jgi:hypothetical protein
MMTNPHVAAVPQDDTVGPKSVRISAGQLLVALRRHRIPCSIDSLSEGGWTARLGDPSRGPYSQQGFFSTRDGAAEWLLEEAERRGAVVR